MTDMNKNETLFNSVEAELARRHAAGDTPDAYANKPRDRLSATVNGWWQLYQESQSIIQMKNRSVWQRDVSMPAVSLDTPELVNSLEQINELISLPSISQFRTPAHYEESAVVLLQRITNYYAALKN